MPVDVSARIVRLPLAETFRIARETSDWAEVVQVEIRHGDTVGFGEAAPIERYDQTAASALAYLEANTDALGADPWALDEIHGRLPHGEPAARSALDAALHDLCGKLAAVPVWKLLGLRRGARRPRGRSASAIRTRWRARPSATRRASSGSSSSSVAETVSTSSASALSAA